MKKTTYQDAMVALLKDIPDHDEHTIVFFRLVSDAQALDSLIDGINSDANRLITYTNSFLRDLNEEAKEGIMPCGSLPLGSDLTRDIYTRHARYVERKEYLFTIIRYLLGDTNHRRFVELLKKD